jgi:ABC-type transporter Mla MlaB component
LKLDLETRAINDVTVLFCRGRFTYRDEATAFSQKMAELLPQARQVVVDFSGLEAIDSAGLGELVVVHMWIRAGMLAETSWAESSDPAHARADELAIGFRCSSHSG